MSIEKDSSIFFKSTNTSGAERPARICGTTSVAPANTCAEDEDESNEVASSTEDGARYFTHFPLSRQALLAGRGVLLRKVVVSSVIVPLNVTEDSLEPWHPSIINQDQ